MPEGDTLHRAATTMAPVLVGKRVLGFRSPLAPLARVALAGVTVTRVEARGKNLLIHFDDGRVLHTHLRMSGSWHLYRPGDRWKKPAFQARAVLEVEGAVAVCFNAPVVRVLTADGLRRDASLAGLGPDTLAPVFDAEEARARLRHRYDPRPLGEAVMVQRAVAGIGNVYKSEILFLLGLDPFAPVAAYTDAELDALLAEARRLMSINVRHYGERITTKGAGAQGPVWVYGRKGKACFKCGTTIAMRRQGELARSTYFCAQCQPRREHVQR